MTKETAACLMSFPSMNLNWLNMLGIALGLAMDAFAVSIAAGLGLSG